MNEGQAIRQEAKTMEQRFLHTMKTDYEFSARLAEGRRSEEDLTPVILPITHALRYPKCKAAFYSD